MAHTRDHLLAALIIREKTIPTRHDHPTYSSRHDNTTNNNVIAMQNKTQNQVALPNRRQPGVSILKFQQEHSLI